MMASDNALAGIDDTAQVTRETREYSKNYASQQTEMTPRKMNSYAAEDAEQIYA
jgi:hypothetical protein